MVAFSAGGDGGSGLLEESKTRLSLGPQAGRASKTPALRGSHLHGAVMISTRTALIAYAIICPLIWGGVMLVHMLQTPGVSQ